MATSGALFETGGNPDEPREYRALSLTQLAQLASDQFGQSYYEELDPRGTRRTALIELLARAERLRQQHEDDPGGWSPSDDDAVDPDSVEGFTDQQLQNLTVQELLAVSHRVGTTTVSVAQPAARTVISTETPLTAAENRWCRQ